jgi:hypothetical protein
MNGDRAGERARFLQLLDQEIERRRFGELGEHPLVSLNRVLDEMAARLRAAPEWKEPTPAEQRRNARKVETWLRKRGYLSRCS